MLTDLKVGCYTLGGLHRGRHASLTTPCPVALSGRAFLVRRTSSRESDPSPGAHLSMYKPLRRRMVNGKAEARSRCKPHVTGNDRSKYRPWEDHAGRRHHHGVGAAGAGGEERLSPASTMFRSERERGSPSPSPMVGVSGPVKPHYAHVGLSGSAPIAIDKHDHRSGADGWSDPGGECG